MKHNEPCYGLTPFFASETGEGVVRAGSTMLSSEGFCCFNATYRLTACAGYRAGAAMK